MWLILVDRSASMGGPLAGNVDEVDQHGSRLSAVVEQLSAPREGLSDSKILFFTAADLTGSAIDHHQLATGHPVPEPAGLADVASALNWAHESVAELDLSIEVQVLLLSDLRTTTDEPELRAAADRLGRRATVQVILVDPRYQTLTVASAIAPGRVQLAASSVGLAAAVAQLLPAGDASGSDGAWSRSDPGTIPSQRQWDDGPPRPTSPPGAPVTGFPMTGAPPAAVPPPPAYPSMPPGPATPAPGSTPPASAGGIVSRAIDAIGSIFHRDSGSTSSRTAPPAPPSPYGQPGPGEPPAAADPAQAPQWGSPSDWDAPAEAASAAPDSYDSPTGSAARQRSPGAAPAPATASADRLSFTVAHPPEMVAGAWHNLLFVLYRTGLRPAVDELLRVRAPELGAEPAEASSTAAAPVSRGTVLTLVPSIPNMSVNPPRLDVAWYEDLQETTFRVCPDNDGGPVRLGSVEVYAGPLLLAVVPLAIRVATAAAATEKIAAVAAPMPLPAEVSHARSIDRVFASYSRRDAWMVDACTAAYQALGVEVLLDRVNLRSGEAWRDSLHSLISQSDIFQLYWSESSAASSEVESEWRFAASLADRGGRFIRPMFWETPMPQPPDELSHLHFSRIELDQINALPG